MVLFDLRMRIPFAAGATVELNETNAALDQAARQETIATKRRGMVVIQTIELLRCFRFFAKVHRFRGFSLHAEGEFVAADARVELAVLRPAGGKLAIELREQFQLSALLRFTNPAWRVQVWERFGRRTQPHALIQGEHEARTPIARTPDDLAVVIAQNRKGGQVLVFRAEAVAHPCAK